MLVSVCLLSPPGRAPHPHPPPPRLRAHVPPGGARRSRVPLQVPSSSAPEDCAACSTSRPLPGTHHSARFLPFLAAHGPHGVSHARPAGPQPLSGESAQSRPLAPTASWGGCHVLWVERPWCPNPHSAPCLPCALGCRPARRLGRVASAPSGEGQQGSGQGPVALRNLSPCPGDLGMDAGPQRPVAWQPLFCPRPVEVSGDPSAVASSCWWQTRLSVERGRGQLEGLALTRVVTSVLSP